MSFRFPALLYILIFIANPSVFAQAVVNPVPVKREFRGVWVATVANIDWPSRQGLPSHVQQQELLRIFDEHQQSGINAIMLQVRPAADALYAKSHEPWSKFLTGRQGVAPFPFYDPLEFAINEAHKRGMELHAWFNPYRASTTLNPADISSEHITRKRPEWFFNYEGKKLFNPGIPEVRKYIVDVILNVVRNYDIDGVHFDDYFYPYPAQRQVIQDAREYNLYGKGFDNIADWRRNNVDLLIKELSDSIHAAKRHVKFGISPFGIWRNKSQDPEGSESTGLSGYSALYGDARKWVREGWIDYINPQIYFPFHYRAAPYEKLVDWWSNNAFGKHVYIGQAAYRATERREGWLDWRQIPNQIRYLRENPRVQGSVFFSSKSLTNNLAGVQDSLRNNFYRYPALQPQMLWLDDVPPLSPLNLTTAVVNGSVILNWQAPLQARDGETAYGYVIYRFEAGKEVNLQNPEGILKILYENKLTSYTDFTAKKGVKYHYAITAIDRLKNESIPSNIGVATAN
ncbi:glycoside hydrolase family 10 protein [Pedobacter sp. SYSU D00535]|uniref:glycoside hydrolase family 10 protein n=1 Tax=Pedobacter sp. SYSU D00535 TaxID=2810308 RepID=UPI001A977DA6|nr:family 10 glycosylhydrolase [Pedobacter sp. SYSU D00535]